MLISSRSINKHGRYRQFLFLIGRFKKIFSDETDWPFTTTSPKWFSLDRGFGLVANVEDWGCCEVNGTAVNDVCGGLPHLRKYDFLNIVKTNIPLRFKGNIINFYFYYFNCWFTWSDNEIHRKTPIGHCACTKNNCAILENSFVYKNKKCNLECNWSMLKLQCRSHTCTCLCSYAHMYMSVYF